MTDLTTDYLSKLDFDHSVLPLYFFRSSASSSSPAFGFWNITDAPPMRFHQDIYANFPTPQKIWTDNSIALQKPQR